MLRKISLASLACVCLCGVSLAQKAVPPEPNTSSKATSEKLTHSQLEAVLKGYAPNLKASIDNGVTSYLWSQDYYPPGKKEALKWTVSAMFSEMPKQSQAVRLWFNCGVLADNFRPADLLAVMEWNGFHKQCRAFFKIVPQGKTKSVYIVLDVPATDMTAEQFPYVMDHYFAFAHDTSGLWQELINPKAITKAATPAAKLQMQDLAGSWSGEVFFDEDKVGEWSAKIEKDGFLVLSRVNTTVKEPKVQILTGMGSINEDGKLVLKLMNVQDDQVYDVSLSGKKLTLSMGEAKSTLEIKLEKK